MVEGDRARLCLPLVILQEPFSRGRRLARRPLGPDLLLLAMTEGISNNEFGSRFVCVLAYECIGRRLLEHGLEGHATHDQAPRAPPGAGGFDADLLG
jgi:hypothetical protein